MEFYKQQANYYQIHLPVEFTYHVQNWANKNHEDSLLARTNIWAAENLFFKQGLNDSGLYHAKIALKIREEIGFVKHIAFSKYQVGVMLNNSGSYSEANEYFLSALSDYQVIDDLNGQKRVLTSLGILNASLKNYGQAITDFEEALEIAIETNDSLRVMHCNTNIATAFLDSVSFQTEKLENTYSSLDLSFLDKEALPRLNIAFSIAKDLNINKEIARIQQNLGFYYTLRDDYERAYKNLVSSLKLQTEAGNTTNILWTYNNLGNLFLKKYRAYNQGINLDTAYFWLITGMKTGEINPANTRYERRKIYSNLQLYFNIINQYDSAYFYLQKYDTLNQAIFNLEKEREIQDARGRYEFEKSQRIIAEQQADIARGRSFNLTLGILSILLLSSTMMLFINRARLRAKAKVAEQEILLVHQRMEDLIRQSELRTINALLEGQEKERVRLSQELHDSVGSVLSAIKLHFTGLTNQWDEMQKDFRETFERGTHLLDVAVEEVRRISHNLTTGVLRKFGLVAALEDLKDTLAGTGQIDFQLFAHGMDDRLEGQLEINLYRVVQELVTNTLKHAQATVITVEVNRRADEINLIISDDGKGFDQSSVKSDGIGLQNMQQRIEKLGGNLHIDSVPGRGTTAVIDIPLTDDE